MRIIYVANARLPTEKAHGYQICKMCEAFAQNGHDVVLLHPYRFQSDPGLRQQSLFDYYGIEPCFQVRTLGNLDVVRIERFFPSGLFMPVSFTHGVMWGLYAALVARVERGDMYFTRDTEVAFWLARLGLPTAYEAHAVPRRGQRWLLRQIAGCRDSLLVVALASTIRDQLVEIGFASEKVYVARHGVEISHFENLPGKDELRSMLHLPSDRPIVGYVGRFRTMGSEKGIPELIEAIGHLRAMGGAQPLLLCVGGPMEAVPAYLAAAARIGMPEEDLRFIDRVSTADVAKWIGCSDVAVVPFPNTEYYAHIMPLKVFEYMAAGVPIVSTDLPSIREVLRHGENAWLVPPGDPKGLAQGIRQLLNQPELAERLGAQAQQEARQYEWKGRAEAILRQLRETAGPDGRSEEKKE